MTQAKSFGMLVEGGSGGYPWGGYRPGTCLTEQTGHISDTAMEWPVERTDAMEREQCDGREAEVCI